MTKLRVQTIDKLDGARTKADDQMMPVWQHSCNCAMGWRGFRRFLGQSSSWTHWSKWFSWPRSCCTIARVCLRGCICIFCVDCGVYWTGVLSTSAWYVIQVFWHQHTYLRHNRCRLCTCARVCTICSLALGDEREGFQLVYAEHSSLGMGVCLVSSLFLTRLGVYVCVYVWIRTHTHTLHVVYSMRGQGSGRDIWRARRIQMD